MKPQCCIAQAEEPGDCYRACVATITGLEIADIPNFKAEHALLTREDNIAFDREVRDFLSDRGLSIFNFYCDGDWPLEKALSFWSGFNVGAPAILTGKPALCGEAAHAVVVLDGVIAHDPSGAGISGPCDPGEGEASYWFFDVICLAQNWTEVQG